MGKKSKKDGFKTPEGYFDGLAERTLDRLKKESDGLPEAEGFKVPDGYFDSLNDEIMAKVRQPETKVIKLTPGRKFLYAAASVAALLLIVIGLQWQDTQGITFDDIASMELEVYFENNTQDMSTYELAELLQADELEITDILDDDWDEENIVEYLGDTIDDLDELNLTDDE